MGLTLTAEPQAFELPPAGTFVAICCHVIDLGTQTLEYQGQTKRAHKIALAWLLPDELKEDGTPFTIGRRFTASLHEKAALRQFLEAWRGRAFTLEELKSFALPRLINAPCLLNIVHMERDGKTYAEVKGASPLPKGMQPPPPVADPIIFDISDPATWHAFDRLTKRQQEAIEASPEWQERQHAAPPATPDDEDVAF
jgi:hypothetical protein